MSLSNTYDFKNLEELEHRAQVFRESLGISRYNNKNLLESLLSNNFFEICDKKPIVYLVSYNSDRKNYQPFIFNAFNLYADERLELFFGL